MTNAGWGVDFAVVAIYLFWGFFIALVLYLRREDRREGYPLEEDDRARLVAAGGFLFTASPKTFRLPLGGGKVSVPNKERDTRPIAARRMSVVTGSPMTPTGNPLVDGVGPAAYAERSRVPDQTMHGQPRMAPMRIATDISIAKGDPDPRGMPVVGTDGEVAGTVADVWVDRGEVFIRYLEVKLASGGANVMLPITMALVDKRRRRVKVDAITAAQFADVPRLENPDQITFYEEERVASYYGGGFLYATPERAEPLI
ncbi:MAG TPA: photosynthetic reaction center subunit H [Rhodospirillaceae bacterium]|nr:photosynthetic reaction center subunit H [Rhodospirillaceae bacterium]